MAKFPLIMCTLSSLLVIELFNSISLTNATLNKTEMIKQIIEGHNMARKVVGVPPLKWKPLLATFARVYSNERRGDCKLVHSTGYGFDELFWGQGRQWSAKDAVAAWVAAKKGYHYASNLCTGKECSHYTQIVWHTTESVGCAKITCNSGDSFIACEYYPPGNYIGARPY